MNDVTLIGRITNDLELKDAGTVKLVNFNIAVNKTGKSGEAVFVSCVAFREVAENLVKFQKKGNLIAIKGSLNNNEYQDKDGNKRSYMNVIANNIQFLESRNKENDIKEQSTSNLKDIKIDDEDIPF